MSMGIGAYANIVLDDGNTVIYEYGGYNLNDPEYYNPDRLCDGLITIPRSCFAEPEVHERIQRMPSGRIRRVVKRVPVYVNYEQMLLDGLIQIEPCSNCWETSSQPPHADVSALRLLFVVFRRYQDEGQIPAHVSFFS